MRRLLYLLLATALLVGALVTPALAGKKAKKKKVHETITAQLFPFPKDERWAEAGFTKPGCTSGEEDIHWTAVPFKAPGKGKLRFYMEGFTGDHDMYVLLDENVFLRGDNAQVGSTTPAPPEEEIVVDMTKGQEVTLVVCNWLGEVDVVGHYEGVFKI